jgi:prepilin signal peptidase PulO-like enzyme (type II secretory pathway)
MGLGDIKLAVVIGWMLGLLGGFSALVFGVWAGALISLLIVGITRLVSHRAGLTMKSEIPFGPFLAAGALFVLLTGSTILDLIL